MRPSHERGKWSTFASLFTGLVPLHARDKTQAGGGKDPRVMKVHGKHQLEYDGLKGGELAWVLGRRQKPMADGVAAELNDPQRYAHQTYTGLGNGVDRMQRLASTGWVEAMIESRIGSKTRVNLHNIMLGTDLQGAMDSQLEFYKTMLAGSTALHCVDLSRELLAANGDDANVAKTLRSMNQLPQGVFVLELGPFLRGMTTGFDSISVKAINGFTPGMDVPRNLGDNCVFAAIETEIRRHNLMDWTPDGVVLSKLESPTDEPHSSIEMDARSGQLFNVAVQGPAISTSWTSDVRDYKLECQPMDKVFICLVADLAWNVDDKMKQPVHDLVKKRQTLFEIIKRLNNIAAEDKAGISDAKVLLAGITNQLSGLGASVADDASNVPDPPFLEAKDAVETLRALVQASEKNTTISEEERKNIRVEYDRAVADFKKLMKFSVENKDDELKVMDQVRKLQMALRNGSDFTAKAVLTNFRLMRSTSSHMANYSNFVIGNNSSRCGLNLGRGNYDTSGGKANGCGEYIVGAWCIGTVIDSAASRSTVGTLVRTAPTSMALNLNVNIEWWSGDRLYKSYMDDSGLTLHRGQNPPEPNATYSAEVILTAGGPFKRKRAEADEDDVNYKWESDDEDVTFDADDWSDFDKSAPGASRVRGSIRVPPTGRPRVA